MSKRRSSTKVGKVTSLGSMSLRRETSTSPQREAWWILEDDAGLRLHLCPSLGYMTRLSRGPMALTPSQSEWIFEIISFVSRMESSMDTNEIISNIHSD